MKIDRLLTIAVNQLDAVKEKSRPANAGRENTVIDSPIRFQHHQNQQGHLQ